MPRRLVALVVAAVVLAACADDDDSAAPTSPPNVSQAASTSTATTVAPARTVPAASTPTASSAPATTASIDATIPGPAAATEWRSSTPEEHGVDSALLADALIAIRDQIPYIHSVTVVQDGSLVLDAYFYPYDGSSPHDVASVTKSITTTLVGIAVDQGLLSLDDSVLSFFADREIANRDERKERITVGDLAAMTSGLACEAEPDEPTLAAMEASPDYVQFALDLPMAAEPGTTFAYCSPGTHLLSAILTQATGVTEFEFAQRELFGPLGFGTVYWPEDPQGFSHGWGDAVVHPRDLAKLGQLFLDGGRWNGKRIVSRAWVTEAVTSHASFGGGTGYGLGWWIEHDPTPGGGEFGALGRGGQFVTVTVALDLVVVLTGGAGDFDDSDVTALIGPTIVDPTSPLPANPGAVARLAATLEALQTPPEPQPVALPDTATTVSGARYLFEPGNVVGVESLRLTFDESAEADLTVTFANGMDPFAGPVGLDGVLRTSPGEWDLPVGMRGAWTDPQTFVLERDEIANNGALLVTAHFEGDQVVVEVRERTVEGAVSVTGTLSATGD
jgi:CubicO group peptidase (beta-lactamase class C family)